MSHRAFARPSILALHRRIERDVLANIKRWQNGRYIWNPQVRRMVAHLEQEAFENEDVSE